MRPYPKNRQIYSESNELKHDKHAPTTVYALYLQHVALSRGERENAVRLRKNSFFTKKNYHILDPFQVIMLLWLIY